jgi:hypothetical protein
MPRFECYLGVDYSGAKQATKPLNGLRVFIAHQGAEPEEIRSPRPRRRNWDRETLARWLTDQLASRSPTILGIDHCFSLPLGHLSRHGLRSWDEVLDDVAEHWPSDRPVRASLDGNPRMGEATEYRLTDQWCPGTKSVFQYRGRGAVFYSTHAGMPWLREMRQELGSTVHFWPFDGFAVPCGKAVVAEAYPAMFKRRYPADFGTPHQVDAYAICRWLQDRDRRDLLAAYLEPALAEEERATARLEGWILGVA